MLASPPSDLIDEPSGELDTRRLPFAFAKRHGVLLIATANGMHLAYRPGTSVTALAEAQRFAGQVQEIVPLELEAFDQALSDAYQHNSSAAMQTASLVPSTRRSPHRGPEPATASRAP